MRRKNLTPYFLFPKTGYFTKWFSKNAKPGDAYLVTGNLKHFPVETFIVTPREMLDIVFSETEFEYYSPRNNACTETKLSDTGGLL